MKKLFAFILIVIALCCFVSCQTTQPPNPDTPIVDNDGNNPANPPQADELIYAWYHYYNEYNSPNKVSVDTTAYDLSYLVTLSNSLTFTDQKPQFFKQKVTYCIRHQNVKNQNAFFPNGNEQYKALDTTFTSNHADVSYALDFVYGQVQQQYTTPNGTVTKYATLTQTQLADVKSAFSLLAESIEPKEGTFSLSNYEIWLDEIDVSDVDKIKIVVDTSTKNDFRYIYTFSMYSTINSTVNRYTEMKVRSIDQQDVPIGSRNVITINFIFKNGTTKLINWYDNQYYYDGTRYLKIVDSQPYDSTLDKSLTYGFTPSIDNTATIFSANGNEICKTTLEQIIFVRATSDVNFADKTPTHYIETEFGKLQFFDDEYFKIESNLFTIDRTDLYYKLVDTTLSKLIADYSK